VHFHVQRGRPVLEHAGLIRADLPHLAPTGLALLVFFGNIMLDALLRQAVQIQRARTPAPTASWRGFILGFLFRR
jgi:hypothetical protein